MNNESRQINATQPASSMYYIAIVLPPSINEQVLQWKQWFRNQFGCTVGLKSPAHITLVPPHWMHIAAEAALAAAVAQFAQNQSTFVLSTQGFSAFKPRTIFAAVQHSDALHQLKQNLETALTANPALNIKKENRPFHPHITLATRDLRPQHFAQAWPHFATKEFQVEWEVASISILKHNGRHWHVWYDVPFGTNRE
ncbi:RNA 2',3'-cyclic phosphodiesterase [Paracnuella aquatica]|uniref:RNA 2',3'-cyclic phosphodiesterase n=1 Tax=Paracnuella aquatica TaxID=2268757 RepID=UPI000DEEC8BF|nr:RNA 2',3'-cyclic phosphodiesterase [Paracnuella aquatica]RPD50604.1 RNA 2',3'-cyclic phosphodiesterase [Paracnuella aquatica]